MNLKNSKTHSHLFIRPGRALRGHCEGGPARHRLGEGGPALLRLGEGGFTLVELLLVLVILGILAAIVVPKFGGRTEQARITAAVTQISTFNTALNAFEVDTGSYPRGQDGLQQLLVQPADITSWRGPYLMADIPLDPWGRAYIYEFPGRVNATGYDIVSMGPDGQAGTPDDVVNASITAK